MMTKNLYFIDDKVIPIQNFIDF